MAVDLAALECADHFDKPSMGLHCFLKSAVDGSSWNIALHEILNA